MKKEFSIAKVVSLGAVALLFLFLGREAPMDLIGGLFNTGAPTAEYVEEVTEIEEVETAENVQTYPVEQVIDGDTLRVTINSISESVRVLGINTPETKFSNRGAECFGTEASVYAKTLLEGSEVTLEQDASQDSRDKYNRILAYVGLADGRDFGQVMIAGGYAYENTFKGRWYKKQEMYKEVQSRAQEEGAGMWKEGVCDSF